MKEGNTVYLSLGTNLGNRKLNLKNALKYIKKNKIKIKKLSSIYKTEPVGYKNQPFFYNMCVKVCTELPPENLLKKIKKIEKKLGRKKGIKWGPRIIDIDILFYNNIILSKKNLKIPHPEIVKRKFVLKPLCEIAGKFIHPELHLSVEELLKKTDLKPKVRKVKEKLYG